jgi:alkylation response protein AidB-like acyl-CoA dehydrogenase
MANLIVDERDQRFVLNEMLEVGKLCESAKYSDFSEDMFDMVMTQAQKLAVEEIFPTLKESDEQGCRLENGQVHVPECFHRPYKLFVEGGWNAMSFPPEVGGQGLPGVIRNAATDWFAHNFSFLSYPGLAEGAAHLVLNYGTADQKQRYFARMVTGEYGGTMCLTEPGAGTDVGNLSTKAIRQPDGTFRLSGTKLFITVGDSDLVKNVIHPVLARIEGDPAGTAGISIFLVPKYLVNDDGTLGRRNDYEIAKIEEKLGIHGSATCLMNFGDKGECYAELLGEERQGMKIMFQLMNEARIGVGLQGLASASIAYLHALNYAKDRQQGSSLLEMKNPQAPRVPIIQHADVRRMLLWMKSHVDAMRGLMYYASYAIDRELIAADEAERDKWKGLLELLTPICKAYCSDVGFKVTELAVQTYGGYGYCSEYPVGQFLRDEKIASIYEGANGIQALDLIGRKLAMKKGAYFIGLLTEMNSTIARYKDALPELATEVQEAVNTLGEIAFFFATCGKQGKFLVPIVHAYPFMMLMGKVVCAWILLWQAGIAKGKLDKLAQAKGVNPADAAGWTCLVKEDKDAAFYAGKQASAKYFVKNVLPEIYSAMRSIKSEDISVLEIAEESFVTN